MKTAYKNMAISALALLMSACSQDNNLAPTYHNAPDAVRITAQVSTGVTGGFTRSNPIGTADKQETEFNNDDQISVSAGTQMTVTYRFDGTSWSPLNDKYLSWQGKTMNFKAWYPAKKGTDFENFTLSYSDKPTLEELAANDYMTFNSSVTRTEDNTVTLAMQRQMVRIVIDEIKYKSQFNEMENPVTSIKITTGSHTFKNGYWGQGLSSAQMFRHTDGKWYAVIPPFESSYSGFKEKPFLEITVQGENTPLIVKGIPNTKRGNSYSYTLTIGKDKADVGDVDITGWTTGVIGDDGNNNIEEYYTFDASTGAEDLKTQMIEAINKNITTFIITMPTDADASLFSAIRQALTIDGIADGSIDLTLSGVKKIPQNAFYVLTNTKEFLTNSLKSVTLPDVTEIGEQAFYQCEHLSSVSAPEVQTIGEYAFGYCERLVTVDMPKVQTIGDNGLENCKFTEISLPEVTALGSSALTSCRNMSKIYLPKVNTIGYSAFQECPALIDVTFGALTSVEHSDYGIFYGTKTQNINLTLSPNQKVMAKNESTETWIPTETDYKDSEDYRNKSFIGFTFKSISFQ